MAAALQCRLGRGPSVAREEGRATGLPMQPPAEPVAIRHGATKPATLSSMPRVTVERRRSTRASSQKTRSTMSHLTSPNASSRQKRDTTTASKRSHALRSTPPRLPTAAAAPPPPPPPPAGVAVVACVPGFSGEAGELGVAGTPGLASAAGVGGKKAPYATSRALSSNNDANVVSVYVLNVWWRSKHFSDATRAHDVTISAATTHSSAGKRSTPSPLPSPPSLPPPPPQPPLPPPPLPPRPPHRHRRHGRSGSVSR